MAQLKTPRYLDQEYSYPCERYHRTLDDLRVKIKQSEVFPGAVEVQVTVDILCLLEDVQGSMHLLKQEETIKNEFPIMILTRLWNARIPSILLSILKTFPVMAG